MERRRQSVRRALAGAGRKSRHYGCPAEDRRRISTRLTVLQVRVVAVFLLGISFWYLQVVQGDQYVELAQNNNQRTLSLRAPRGVLFDRNGKVLVENRNSFTISIDREDDEGSGAHGASAGRDRQAGPSRGAADRRAASRRAELPPDRRHRGRHARAGRQHPGAALSNCPKCVDRGGAHRASIRSTRWRRTCSATSAKRATRRSATAFRAARSSASPASSRSTTSC